MANKELPTRQFRTKPFCWQEKKILRLLRKIYGKEKRKFLSRRSVYFALTEIASDFGSDVITQYIKTIGTYSGVSRQTTSKVLKEFEKLGILKIEIKRDARGRFTEREVYLLGGYPLTVEPNTDDPSSADLTHKKVTLDKEDNLNKNASFKKRPYYYNEEMRMKSGKWYVIPKEGGPWKEFAGDEKDIEWK